MILAGWLLVSCCVQMWERLREGLGSTDLLTAACPRGIHADGSCTCQSGLPTEDSGSRAISRIVLLAQALSEVFFWMNSLNTHILHLSISLFLSKSNLTQAN